MGTCGCCFLLVQHFLYPANEFFLCFVDDNSTSDAAADGLAKLKIDSSTTKTAASENTDWVSFD